MKITKVEVFIVKTRNNNMSTPVGCRIWTDEGLFGDGEAGIAYGVGHTAAFGMVCDLANLVIGMDPMQTELAWNKMYKNTFWGQNGGPIVFAGIAAIDIALWDIKGKALGLPIYQLLGGKVRDSLRCYASQLQLGWGFFGKSEQLWTAKPEDYAHNCKLALEEGYDAVKVDFYDKDSNGKMYDSLDMGGIIPADKLYMVEERVAACRDAVGPKVDIIMENHSHADAPGAVQLGQIADKYKLFAFEEGNTPNIQTSEYIAQHVHTPLANGERLFGRSMYAPFFQRNLIQLAQPDLCNCGGITEVKKICDMAYSYDVGVQIHVCGSPLTTSIALQVEAAIPNFCIHEHHVVNRMESAVGITEENLQPQDGKLQVPDAPGHGNAWTESAVHDALEYRCIEGGSQWHPGE